MQTSTQNRNLTGSPDATQWNPGNVDPDFLGIDAASKHA